MEDSDEFSCFLLYISIVSFQFHPGVKERLTPLECSIKTWEYMSEFKKRGDVWRGLDQQLEPVRRSLGT